jgi:List-Bact-rpt repeat protein
MKTPSCVLLTLALSSCTCTQGPGGPDGGEDAGQLPDGGYALAVSVFGSGTGTVTSAPGGLSCRPSCAGFAAPSSEVTLTATPSNGSTFLAWRGACSGTNPTCTLTMDGAKAATAVFNPPSAVAGVYTWKYDGSRQGQNPSEATLTRANVNPSQFGKLASYALDGYTYAQPLYVSGVATPGGVYNVVYVATEHDTVYAFDADREASGPLWKVSFINPPGVVTVPAADTGETGDLIPECGISGTPVIDPATQTLYVVANTKEAGPTYPYRLHALDLRTGAEKFGGPVIVSATAGTVDFEPITHLQRPALLLLNGVVYVAFGSHGDHSTWQGWVMGFDAATLAPRGVYVTAPDGQAGSAIWQGGAGPAADSRGGLYFETGNGPYDGTNMGDSVVRLRTDTGLARSDWFTPSDQDTYRAADIDLGSAGPVVLPGAVGSASHRDLVVATGKPGVLYLLDQANMGQYQAGGSDTQIVQSLPINASFPNVGDLSAGVFNSHAFWNGGTSTTGTLYVNAVQSTGPDALRAFSISGATLSVSPAGVTARTFPYPGVAPVVTSLGTANSIVWVIEIGGYRPTQNAILRAFDGSRLATELYNSTSAAGARDAAGPAVKFTVPLVVNGKAYVASQTSLSIYGLLP